MNDLPEPYEAFELWLADPKNGFRDVYEATPENVDLARLSEAVEVYAGFNSLPGISVFPLKICATYARKILPHLGRPGGRVEGKMKDYEFQYTVLGDVVILNKKDWAIVLRWLRKNGVDVRKTRKAKPISKRRQNERRD